MSLKWKLLLVMGVLLAGLFTGFAVLNHQSLQGQYEELRAMEQQRSRLQLTGLLQQSRNDLLNLAHLVPSLSGLRQALKQGDAGELGRLFAPQWASLQVDTDLVMAGFLDVHGRFLVEVQILEAPHEWPSRLWPAVDQALLAEAPSTFTDCTTLCLSYAVAPVLANGRTVGAVVLARPMSHLVVSFNELSALDVAMFSLDPAAAAGSGARQPRMMGITSRERLESLLHAGVLEGLSPGQVTMHSLEGRRELELSPFLLLDDASTHQILAVVIADVTEARRQITIAQRQNVLMGVIGLILFAMVIVATTRMPLVRLHRVASLLPLLAERRFDAVRSELASPLQPFLPDELSLLERTTLKLADRLERLEADVRRQRDSLDLKVQELSIERERYALAAAGTNDGIWDWDLETGKIFYSPRWQTMLGYEAGELTSHPDEWLGRLHPDDRPRLQQELDSHLAGRSPCLEVECRMRHATEGYLWMYFRGLGVRNDFGKAHRIAGSMSDVTERRRIEEQLRHDALHDHLTQLPNRTLFVDRLQRAISRYRRSGSGYAVVFLDLDNFKTVNDSLGHIFGDQMLIQFGRRLQQCLRPGDSVARFGGDEFVLLLEDIASENEVHQVVARLQAVTQSPVRVGDQDIFVSFSVGIALGSPEDRSADDVLRNADTAMYQAKIHNPGNSMFFSGGMRASAVHRLNLETAMRRALDRHEFVLHYQPLVSMKDGRLLGFEALLRWPRLGERPVSPADFIPLAEQTGLIIPMGRWVVEQAVEQVARWQRMGLPVSGADLPININVSGKQFRDPELVSVIERSLKHHGVSGRCLKVELTESAVLDNGSQALEVMGALKDAGIDLCMDDFGTGYSSLSQLRDLPFDVVKIDRSFVHRLTSDPRHVGIVRAVTSIARELNKSLVAEGVETPEQVSSLLDLGCTVGQGFLFSPAVEAERVEAWVADPKDCFAAVIGRRDA
ncbi:PAS/PAC and GAF sensor-containing diguanylate cyclase/phosphodiesterase [Ectothiorhodospira sp. PHS-1]|uniref:bifunctional diguanylate cyclase/phosphodiesterase n=1 Tax=Ectothiorhodospira sp. PHS-1 TaxID=519989 RepID=UPI00024A896D|nr:EAL domain-containing protein [Ectothiorhodospira sp. PHS-1]EHQ51326.1 PAS/PAC and GAF sensor-containing diguanylate cyclase/phosphodiesterase [Ectothiorhodospira sp. PHS-1]